MFLHKVISLAVLLTICTCHWMCDLAGFACDEQEKGSEFCFAGTFDSWPKFRAVVALGMKYETFCALACKNTGCSCLLYIPGKF